VADGGRRGECESVGVSGAAVRQLMASQSAAREAVLR
jgi:hypothetical protein